MTVPGHATSWYAATAVDVPYLPTVDTDLSCDVCIVGGGYTGLTAALILAERGYDVVLLEAERIGWGASGRNGGQIVTGYAPAMTSISRWVGADAARQLWDLGEEGKAIIRDRIVRHGIDCDLAWGYLFAALKSRHLSSLREAADDWQHYGYGDVHLLGRAETRALVATDRYLGGLYDAGSGHLHPLNYALGLARAATAAGARLFERSRVTRVDTGPTPLAVTAAGQVRAKFMILGVGAYGGGLIPAMARYIMPISTTMITTEPLGAQRAEALLSRNIAVSDVNYALNYFRLTPDHRLLFGGGVSGTGVDRPGLALDLRKKLVSLFPTLHDVPIDYSWSGLLDISMNRAPHFGRLGPTTLFAQGFSGHGLALTAIAGRVMAEVIAGTAERFDMFARLPHLPFPGGPMWGKPAVLLGMTWYRLRDLL
ncbi:MAG: FAD-binding oxidoreductase [Azospirillaceae bacterium]|nr:FAD-binding oxidoreductase [Azospirillaceae bacterium]